MLIVVSGEEGEGHREGLAVATSARTMVFSLIKSLSALLDSKDSEQRADGWGFVRDGSGKVQVLRYVVSGHCWSRDLA